jgi:serine/threonine-protein kinase HipA
VQLTPAYDLISTTLYGDHKMALKLDGRDDRITRKSILTFGSRYGLTEKAIEHMLNKLFKAVQKNYPSLRNIPLPEKKQTHLERVLAKRAGKLSQ